MPRTNQKKECDAFRGARARCENPKVYSYRWYGAKGIKFLFSSFDEFLASVGPAPSPQHSIDRINSLGNYEAGNVRWATPDVQQHNRSFTYGNRRTHCKKGHEFTAGNTTFRIKASGLRVRVCVTCKRYWNTQVYRDYLAAA